MGVKYPILTTDRLKFVPNQGYTFVETTNPNLKIDGYPVITFVTWTSKTYPYPTGTIPATDVSTASTKIDNLGVILVDPSVATFYSPTPPYSAISD